MPPMSSLESGSQAITRRAALSAVASGMLIAGAAHLSAESTRFQEAEDPQRIVRNTLTVKTTGSVFTSATKDKSQKHPLAATAQFVFQERRLPSGGRDSLAFRAAREFESASLKTSVSGRETQSVLPTANRLIVANGTGAGVWSYCPTSLLTRETMDLLELPCDPLALQAILPAEGLDVGGKWSAPGWSAQMLGTVEAVQKAEINGEVVSREAGKAILKIEGRILGQRYGSNTDVRIAGQITFDESVRLISAAVLTYTVKANIGTVSPGIDAQVETTLTRQVEKTSDTLTNQWIESIPISPPESVSMLALDALPWKIQLLHDRSWHLFQSVFEGPAQVVILRLMENGGLICQCNVAQIPAAPPGQHAPIEQFEADIERSLGKRFTAIQTRNKLPTDDGRLVYRVIVEGQNTLISDKGTVEVPMEWHYFLCAAPSGRQLSFVFAIEPKLAEQLGDRDVEMVRSVRFLR